MFQSRYIIIDFYIMEDLYFSMYIFEGRDYKEYFWVGATE